MDNSECGGLPTSQSSRTGFYGQGIQHTGSGSLIVQGVTIGASSNDKDRGLRLLRKLRATDPKIVKSRIERQKGPLLRDPYRWIIANNDFQRWRAAEDDRMLWIKGDPGKGKTMLVCGIIDELTGKAGKRKVFVQPLNVAYFFCQASVPSLNNATAVLSGLISHLLKQQMSLLEQLYEEHIDIEEQLSRDYDLWDTLCTMLFGMLQNPILQETYLIIDALDECSEGLPELLWLIIRASSFNVRILVSSRNGPMIEAELRKNPSNVSLCLELNAEAISAAVDTYIEYQVQQLSHTKRYTEATRQVVHRHLKSNAGNTFLWVALVCQKLGELNVYEWDAQETLKLFPPGLSELYTRMAKNILNFEDKLPCRQILAVVLIVHRPISLRELPIYVPHLAAFLGRLQDILELCGSFLTLRDDTIYFVHLSAKEFLLDKMLGPLFPQGIHKEHHRIFLTSMNIMSETLRRNIYCLPLMRSELYFIQSPVPDPLEPVKYATVYWVDHFVDGIVERIKDAQIDVEDGRILLNFFQQHLLHWIEGLGLLGSIPAGIVMMLKLKSFLHINGSQHTVKTATLPITDLATLADDTWRFLRCHKRGLEEDPIQAYSSALLLSPNRSLVKTIYQANEPEWLLVKPTMEYDWDACLQTLEGHRACVRGVDFSSDGTHVVSISDDGTLKLWDTATGWCRKTLEIDSKINPEATLQVGELILLTFFDNTKILWDIAAGQRKRIPKRCRMPLALSPDGKVFASVTRSDNTISLWNISTDQCERVLEGHGDEITKIAFSGNGTQIASGSLDATIKIWDATTSQCSATLEGHHGEIYALGISSDGKVASVSFDSAIKLWNPAEGWRERTLSQSDEEDPLTYSTNTIVFSPDGKLLATAGDDIRLWNADTGQCTAIFEGHGSGISAVAFSPDGKQIVSGSRDEKLKLWNIAGGYIPESDPEQFIIMDLASDGKHVASATSERAIKLWDVTTGQCNGTLEGHTGAIRTIHFFPNARKMASLSCDQTIKLWDIDTGQCQRTLTGLGPSMYGLTISSDGKHIAVRSTDTVKLWNTDTGRCKWNFDSRDRLVSTIAFTQNGRQIALVSEGGGSTIKLWDIATKQWEMERYLVPMGEDVYIQNMAFSPTKGSMLATSSTDMTIQVWEITTGHCERTLTGHNRRICQVVFSPNGKKLASSSWDRTVKLWDINTGQCEWTVEGFSTELTFSPSGKKLYANFGSINLSLLGSGDVLEPQRALGLHMSPADEWIRVGSKRLLWIPSEHRSYASRVRNSLVVIATLKGQVLFFRFAEDIISQ